MKKPHFNGSDYDPILDDTRLTKQIDGIFNLMRDKKWRTLQEIELSTGYPQASISAQLRHLRKKRFGGHIVNKQSRGERITGLFEYQLIIST
jgi:predicted transcriptional regulator